MLKKEGFASQAITGATWNISASIVQRIGGLIFTILLARFLLPDGFGLYNLAIAIGAVFFIFSQNGIDSTFIRYFSQALKMNDKKLETSYFRYITNLKIIFLFFSLVFLLALSYPISFFIFNKPEIFFLLILVSIYLFFLSLVEFFTVFFFTIKKVKYKLIKEVIYQVIRIILLIFIFKIIFIDSKISYAFFTLIIVSMIILIFILSIIYKISPHLFKRGERLNIKTRNEIINFSIFISLSSVSIVFLGNIDTLMIGKLIGDNSLIGFYTSAFIIISSLSGLFSFGQVLLPFFVQVKENNLEFIFNKSLKYSMILAMPAAFGLAILSNYALLLLYGREYVQGYLALSILSFLLILSVFASLATELFSTKNRPRDYLPLLIFIVILDVILNYFLIIYFSTYGINLAIVGAAIATIICWFIYCIGLYILSRNKLGITIATSVMIKPFFAAMIMSVILYFLKTNISDINLFNGILLVISGIFLYSFILILIKGFDREDYRIIGIFIKKFTGFFNK